MSKGLEIVRKHMDHAGVIGQWEYLADNIDRAIAAAVCEEADLRRKAWNVTAHAIYDQLEKIGVSYTRGGDTLESGTFRNDALAGLEPGDVATLVELVQRYNIEHNLTARDESGEYVQICPCPMCAKATPLIARLPK